uniref:exosome complex component RRP41-like n=1 Tax=Styela clava TaxID=7725 RepID=UPI00193932BE|nr:exosome complex component RRP41-like [Styela clava]
MAGLELVTDEGYRIDGRLPTELRRIRCRLGVFSQADGSSYLEQGNTKILAAVYGPHEPSSNMRGQILSDKAFLNCEYSQATFSTAERKHRSRGDRKGQELSMHIKQTFEAAILTELYPRSQIDIYLQVLHSDGSNYCVCVNAATLALIDAGIALKDFVCACSVSVHKSIALKDINRVEENSNCPELMAAMLPKLDQIIYVEQNGRLHADEMSKALETVSSGCQDIFILLDTAVQDHVRDLTTNIGGDV